MAQIKTTFYPVALDFDTIMDLVGNPAAESFEGAYVGARNLHLYPGKFGGGHAFRKMGGTVEIPWEPPRLGINSGMGSFWDERNNTLICFIKNDVGGDSIIWHRPDTNQTSTIRIPGGVRGRVTGCVFINAELLIWTDNVDYPKCIDLPRADSLEKKSKVRLYFPQAAGLVDSRRFTAQVVLDGNPIGPMVTSPDIQDANTLSVRDFRPMVAAFAMDWGNVPALSSLFTAHGCSDYVELEATTIGMYTVQVTVQDTINGIQQPVVQCVAEYVNRYSDQWTFAQMRLSRFKPLFPPIVSTGTDQARKSSLIRKGMFQFQYGFRLRNKEKTPLSPVSDLAISAASPCGGAGAVPNYIDVDFSGDKWLMDPTTRGEVEGVDIYVRDGNLGAWLLAKSMEKYEWVYSKRWKFYNDGIYPPADPLFAAASKTYVPPRAKALSEFVDIDDFTRIVFGNTREGDANPCVQVAVKAKLDTADSIEQTASVIARIWIRGFFDPTGPPGAWGGPYELNQAVLVYDNAIGPVFGGMGAGIVGHTGDPETWGQKLPLGGFVIYAKGTDRFGISTQVRPVAFLPCGTNSPTQWVPVDPDDPANNRGVYDATQTGGVLPVVGNPCNESHRAAIRRAIENIAVYSDVRIDGLREGETYVLCLADFGTTLEDLNSPGLGWQRKSGAVIEMGTINSASIKSTRDQCTVTIPVGAGGTVIDIGEISIADVTNPMVVAGSLKVDGFLFDALGTDYSPANDIRETGVSAERQYVVFQRYVGGAWQGNFSGSLSSPWPWLDDMFNLGITSTDHNGYFWFFQQSDATGVARAAALGVTGDPGNPSGILTTFTNSSVVVTGFQVMNDINGSKWEGDISGALVAAGPNLIGNGWKRYIFANLNTSTSLRTHIRARVVDVNGTPLQGVGAILEGGRYTETDTSGNINLVAFGDAYQNLDKRVVDRLVWYAKGPCKLEMPIGGKIVNVFIDPFWAGNPFSESPDANHFLLADKVATMQSLAGRRCFSRGGVYSIGYILYRWDGSGTDVKWVADVPIPNFAQDLVEYDPLEYPPTLFPNGHWIYGPASLGFTISGDVPIPEFGRYEAFQLVMRPDGTRSFQLQWIAGEVIYSSEWSEASAEPTPVGYASATATEVYVVLTDPLTRYKDLNTDSMLGYLWQEGDMIRILSDRNGQPLTEVIEAPIVGQRGTWIILKASSDVPRLYGGEAIEIFTPAKATEADSGRPYFAIPDGAVEILDPYGAAPSWSVTSGTIVDGDTYLVPTNVPFRSSEASPWTSRQWTRESRSLSDFHPSDSWGMGKASFVDPDASVQHRAVLMRYSDAYLPNTNTNGLNFFGGFNVKITENWLGEIQRIMAMQESFVVPCTNGTFAIYKGIQQLKETAESLTQVSGGVLANIRPMAHHYGTVDPQAVMRTATTILAFDRRKGVIWQWASNQLQPVSTQRRVKAYVMRKAEGMPPDSLAVAGWDQVNGEVLFTFPSVSYTEIGADGLPQSAKDPAETFQFYDDRNAFVANMDWAPDFWGHTSLALYSFYKGQLLRHEYLFDQNSLNVIGGVQRDLEVVIPFAGDPSVVKDMQDIWIGAGPGWEMEQMTNNMGQESRVTVWESPEGNIYKGTMIGNTHPSQVIGDVLKATWYRFKFTHRGPSPCSLVWVRFGWTPSADSDMNQQGQ